MPNVDRTDNFMGRLGFRVYRVGGSVRDGLLRRPIKDTDYVARLDQPTLKRTLREKGLDVGDLVLRTGQIAGVRASGHPVGVVEVVLPRTERKVARTDGNERHAVEFIVDPNLPLEEDALRRDLTINALYKNLGLEGDVLDPTGLGVSDIENRVIRTTHSSSFRDDPLRILRALRFFSVLDGFTVAPETIEEMREHAQAVTGLTGKGVSGTAKDELFKLLMGDNVANALRLAAETGVLAAFLPELTEMLDFEQENDHHDLTVSEHTFAAIDAAARMGCSLRVRLALLFHDAGKPMVAWRDEDGALRYFDDGKPHVRELTGEEMPSEDHADASARLLRTAGKRLNIDNALLNDAVLIVRKHMVPLTMKLRPTKVRKWRIEIGDDLLAELLKHRLSDIMGKTVIQYEDISAIARLERIREEAVEQGIPASAKDLKNMGLIDGKDLIEMGIAGKDIGAVLSQLLHEVVAQPKLANRDWMLGRAAKLASK